MRSRRVGGIFILIVMENKDAHIHGGVVDTVNCQGNVYMHGGVVEKLICQGDCKQYGGIVEQRVIVAGSSAMAQQQIQQAKTKVVYKDRIVYKDNPQHEFLMRKFEREELEKKEPRLPSDDVLVRRIRSLEKQLDKEREAHKKDVEDLKERINVVMEINAKLRQRNDESDRRSQEIADNHIDILATLMAAYPFTPDKDLEFEFGIPLPRIRDTAKLLGQIKSPEARAEAREYLQKQHLELIERRGGDQGSHNNMKAIEMVSRNGKVIRTYKSAKSAANGCNLCDKTIRDYCYSYSRKRRFTKNGYTFRYKENENQNS